MLYDFALRLIHLQKLRKKISRQGQLWKQGHLLIVVATFPKTLASMCLFSMLVCTR